MSATLSPAHGAGALQIGTPNILSIAPLEGALELHIEAGIDRVRRKSLALTRFLHAMIAAELSDVGVVVVTPVQDERSGGHIAVRHPEAARICKALRAGEVVPDYRPPDLIRLAPVALYTRFVDCVEAVATLVEVMTTTAYRQEKDGRDLVP